MSAESGDTSTLAGLATQNPFRCRYLAPESEFARLKVSSQIHQVGIWNFVGAGLWSSSIEYLDNNLVAKAFLFKRAEASESAYRNALREEKLRQERETRSLNDARKEALELYQEALAMGTRDAWDLLGTLHIEGPQTLTELLAKLGNTADAFDSLVNLGVVGFVKFAGGLLSISSLGAKVLNTFGLGSEEQKPASY